MSITDNEKEYTVSFEHPKFGYGRVEIDGRFTVLARAESEREDAEQLADDIENAVNGIIRDFGKKQQEDA